MTVGQRASYEESFDDLAAVAQRVAYRLLGDRHEAEELGQEALARAYVRWRRVEPYAEAWVARVTANLALDRHRARLRRGRYQAALARQRAGVAPDGAAHLVSRAELVAGLRALPRRQREVVVLRYLADVPEAATAEMLGCSVGTVKQHASRGLAALRLTVTHPSAPDPDPDPVLRASARIPLRGRPAPAHPRPS